MVQLGWIGLGNMGRGMVLNLVTKHKLDQPMLLFNRNNTRSQDLAEKLNKDGDKVAVSPSLADLVQKSDVIFTCVANDAAIKETLQGAIDSGDIKGKLFIECSTVSVETTDEVSELIVSTGAKFVAAPVFGAPAMADAGMLIFVLAASTESWIDEAIPYTKGVMGREYIDLREKTPGTASLLKLSGNHLVLAMVLGLSESMVLASKSGLGEEHIMHFVETLFGGPYPAYAKRMLTGDYATNEPKFVVDLALKDAGHINNLGKANGVRLGIIDEVTKLLHIVKQEKGEKGDMPGIYGAKRVESGLPYAKEKTD